MYLVASEGLMTSSLEEPETVRAMSSRISSACENENNNHLDKSPELHRFHSDSWGGKKTLSLRLVSGFIAVSHHHTLTVEEVNVRLLLIFTFADQHEQRWEVFHRVDGVAAQDGF